MRFQLLLASIFCIVGCSAEKQTPADPTLKAPNFHDQQPDPWSVDATERAQAAAEQTVRVHANFTENVSGWTFDAAGFPEYMRGQVGFFAGRTQSPLGAPALELRGVNQSVTLFMFMYRQLTLTDGIEAGREYRLKTRVKMISGAAKDCMGAGGSPGEVAFRAGAFAEIVQKVYDANGTLRVNHDPWAKPQAFSFVGSIDNGRVCNPQLNDYVRITRQSVKNQVVTASADGTLTVLLGVSGGFIGETRLWIESLDVILEPIL